MNEYLIIILVGSLAGGAALSACGYIGHRYKHKLSKGARRALKIVGWAGGILSFSLHFYLFFSLLGTYMRYKHE